MRNNNHATRYLIITGIVSLIPSVGFAITATDPDGGQRNAGPPPAGSSWPAPAAARGTSFVKATPQGGARPSTSQTVRLNRAAIAAYAHQWTHDDRQYPNNTYTNPSYPYIVISGQREDCTNFTSQALRAGGWPEVNVLNNGNDDHQWFHSGFFGKPSHTWANAQDFSIFIPSRATQVGSVDQLQLGDIMQLDQNGNGQWDHSVIVTRKDRTGIYFTYHSTNTVDISYQALQARVRSANPGKRSQYRFWHLKDVL